MSLRILSVTYGLFIIKYTNEVYGWTNLDICKAVLHLWYNTKIIRMRTPPSTTWYLHNLHQYALLGIK